MTEVLMAMTNRPLPRNAVRTTLRIDGSPGARAPYHGLYL
jgi:hypothetical protein